MTNLYILTRKDPQAGYYYDTFRSILVAADNPIQACEITPVNYTVSEEGLPVLHVNNYDFGWGNDPEQKWVPTSDDVYVSYVGEAGGWIKPGTIVHANFRHG